MSIVLPVDPHLLITFILKKARTTSEVLHFYHLEVNCDDNKFSKSTDFYDDQLCSIRLKSSTNLVKFVEGLGNCLFQSACLFIVCLCEPQSGHKSLLICQLDLWDFIVSQDFIVHCDSEINVRPLPF